ncbi:hypothetical protein ACFYO1_02335 [Nocardia sp. NPDC006044]|uniref:hypothetical protein n=1 Tax=Nocardia sp. NPDC006044 TaxID=3364306 RepID=UPI00368B8BBD
MASSTDGFLAQPVKLSPKLKNWYSGATDSLASWMVAVYKSYGYMKKPEDVPHMDVPAVRPMRLEGAQQSAAITAYQDAVARIGTASDRFNKLQTDMVSAISDLTEIKKNGQDDIGKLIKAINQVVSGIMVDPAGGETLDSVFLDLIAQATTKIQDNFDKGTDGVDGTEKRLAALEAALKQQPNPNLPNPNPNPNLPNPNQPNPNPLDPNLYKPQNPPADDLNKLAGNPNGLDKPTGVEPPNNLDSDLQRAIDQITRQGTNPPVSAPMMPSSSPFGAGMDPNSLMNQLAQQDMMRRLNGDNPMDRRPPIDQPPAQRPPAPAQPQATRQSPSTPWTNNGTPVTTNGTSASPAQQAGTAANVSSSQSGTPAPARIPAADGSVLYTYPPPETRSQRVSAAVAQALDAAFANHGATDAQDAYKSTKAKWSDNKQIGDRVDPNQLMTGDVAIWDRNTALLVVFGPDQGGTLEVIVKGKKQSLADLLAGNDAQSPAAATSGEGKPSPSTETSSNSSEFGDFLGFAHPPGIELTGSGEPAVAAPQAGDPSTSMPAVTSA